jgi:hypothetical protein
LIQPFTPNNTIKMQSPYSTLLLASALTCVAASTGWAQVNDYSQDFESLDAASATVLGDDGWLVGANVFDPSGGYLYGYFAFPAPNGGPAFSAVASGEGGPAQGAQQLVVYNDYNNGDHAVGNLIEANVFREQVITAADVGRTLLFSFDAKLGDLQPPTTATAFIKIINTTTWYMDDNDYLDMTGVPSTWDSYSLSMTIDSSFVGNLFQIGFMNTATNYTASGVVYDNITLAEDSGGVSPGTAFCIGDGGGTACPCGNISTNGGGCANGSGDGNVLSASGSNSISAADLELSSANAIPSQPGLYFQGNNAINGGNGNIFGDGLRCAGGGVIRLQVRFSDGTGGSATSIDIGAKGGVSAGDVKRYQHWSRDPNTSPCGSMFNLSNGIEITWSA